MSITKGLLIQQHRSRTWRPWPKLLNQFLIFSLFFRNWSIYSATVCGGTIFSRFYCYCSNWLLWSAALHAKISPQVTTMLQWRAQKMSSKWTNKRALCYKYWPANEQLTNSYWPVCCNYEWWFWICSEKCVSSFSHCPHWALLIKTFLNTQNLTQIGQLAHAGFPSGSGWSRLLSDAASLFCFQVALPAYSSPPNHLLTQSYNTFKEVRDDIVPKSLSSQY